MFDKDRAIPSIPIRKNAPQRDRPKDQNEDHCKKIDKIKSKKFANHTIQCFKTYTLASKFVIPNLPAGRKVQTNA
jgi:hypothetical protein